ncbi:hypothetical protein [Haloarcula montana]|uniref:hypothetical protein n=1 Tax=Haloarcula montana TaxID=3111776 RepID=UPI002D7914B0|nr:hypothetical protein [Haloarcula sp. GH36]
MSYFDSEFASVDYDSDSDAIVARMTDFAEGEPFREYMNAIIDAIEDTGSSRVVADTSQMGALAEEDQVWSVKDWAPRAEDSGLDHMALVMPESVVAEMSVDSVVEMADDTINRDLFEDADEALDWIARQ